VAVSVFRALSVRAAGLYTCGGTKFIRKPRRDVYAKLLNATALAHSA
jgi:hypothetical protein